MGSGSCDPAMPSKLVGDERFEGIDANLSDFWRLAMSDLQMNDVQGHLAEFLVARAFAWLVTPSAILSPWRSPAVRPSSDASDGDPSRTDANDLTRC